MASEKILTCNIFDTDTVESCDMRIIGSGFWREYTDMKVEMYRKFADQYQEGIEKFKWRIDNITGEEDVNWKRSLRKELDRDEGMIKLFEAYNKTYSKFSSELAELDHMIHVQEEDLRRNIKEYRKLEKGWLTIQKDLTTKKEKIDHRVDKLDMLLKGDRKKHKDKIKDLTKKIQKSTADYDALILTEGRKRPELLLKSIDVEHQHQDKERKRLNRLVGNWQDCLRSLQNDVINYAETCNDVKASKYADKIEPELVVKKTSRRKRADYSAFETSTTLISNKPDVEKFLKSLKERPSSGEDCKTDDSATSGKNQETTNQERSKTKRPQRKENKNDAKEQEEETIVKPFKQEDVTEVDRPIRPLPARPLPAIPTTSGLKTTKQQQVETSGSESESDEEIHEKKDEAPAAFVQYKAKVTKKYKKAREEELSVSRGDKVTVLERPAANGYVFVSKKSTFKLQKKRGLVPLSHIIPLDRK